jgi:hypothetical protein
MFGDRIITKLLSPLRFPDIIWRLKAGIVEPEETAFLGKRPVNTFTSQQIHKPKTEEPLKAVLYKPSLPQLYNEDQLDNRVSSVSSDGRVCIFWELSTRFAKYGGWSRCKKYQQVIQQTENQSKNEFSWYSIADRVAMCNEVHRKMWEGYYTIYWTNF